MKFFVHVDYVELRSEYRFSNRSPFLVAQALSHKRSGRLSLLRRVCNEVFKKALEMQMSASLQVSMSLFIPCFLSSSWLAFLESVEMIALRASVCKKCG